MVEIVGCESQYKFKQPQPKNKNGTYDHGLFQINDSWNNRAKKMGIDLDTIQGQFEFAKYLKEQNGLKDWNSSRHCWGKKIKKTA
jgi:hypothetical protein